MTGNEILIERLRALERKIEGLKGVYFYGNKWIDFAEFQTDLNQIIGDLELGILGIDEEQEMRRRERLEAFFKSGREKERWY